MMGGGRDNGVEKNYHAHAGWLVVSAKILYNIFIGIDSDYALGSPLANIRLPLVGGTLY